MYLHKLAANKVAFLLILILALGSFLRAHDLGTESIGLDEASSIHESALSLSSENRRAVGL